LEIFKKRFWEEIKDMKQATSKETSKEKSGNYQIFDKKINNDFENNIKKENIEDEDINENINEDENMNNYCIDNSIEKYLNNIDFESLSSFYNRNKVRNHRITFALNDKEKNKLLSDQKRKGFYNLSEYIRDVLIYNQKGTKERFSSELILKLSKLGETVNNFNEPSPNKLKKMVIEELIKIIKEIG